MTINSARFCVVALVVLWSSGCEKPASRGAEKPGGVVPVYNAQSGKLEQLVSASKGDGLIDRRAVMDGVRVKSVQLDRDHDGKPDRWEFFEPVTSGSETRDLLVRAEVANGPSGKVNRREFYDRGVIARIEEDTDSDGKFDTWHYYEQGGLVRVDLDLEGRGTPNRRLVYGKNGALDHIEVDASGTGQWQRLKTPAAGPPARKGRGQ